MSLTLIIVIVLAIIFIVIGFSIVIVRLNRNEQGAKKKKKKVDETHLYDSIGDKGEKKINALINKFIQQNPDSLFIKEVIIPYNDSTCEIDQILFCKYGVFVFETKNWRGIVTGNYDDKIWTLTQGENIFERKNPIYQNEKHAEALNLIINVKPNRLFNKIVFAFKEKTDLKLDEKAKNFVLISSDLLFYLNSFKNDYYSKYQIKALYDKVNHYVLNPPCTKEEHIENLKKIHDK